VQAYKGGRILEARAQSIRKTGGSVSSKGGDDVGNVNREDRFNYVIVVGDGNIHRRVAHGFAAITDGGKNPKSGVGL
jgi:hypothetical protein